MNRVLRFFTRPRHLRIPQLPQFRLFPPRAVHAAISTFWQHIALPRYQLKYATMLTLLGFSSWLSICYFLRNPVALPPELRTAVGSLYTRAEAHIQALAPPPLVVAEDPAPSSDGSESAVAHLVSVAFGAVGMRLRQLWGSSRAPAPVMCVKCSLQTPDVVLLPCGHLVLCEACYGEMCGGAVGVEVECPRCGVVVVDQVKVVL